MTQELLSKFKKSFQVIFFTMVLGSLPFGADIQAQLTVTYQKTNVTCNGANNGCASLTITGGCTPYSIEWSNSVGGIIGAGLIQCGLYPGNTTVLIEDDCGQVIAEQISIVEPEILIAFFTNQMPATCFGACDATVEVQILGGTAPFSGSYPSGAIVSADGLSISGLCPGLLILPISDANGCSTSAAAFLEEPTTPLLTTVTGTNATSCNGNDGQASISASGGAPPYAYSWTNASGTQVASGSIIQGLSPGTYSVAVQDFNSCIVTEQVNIAGAQQSGPNSLIINAPIVSSDQYFAQSWIQSNAVIFPGINVEFSAGDYIDLKPSFHTFAGTDFHAFIEECP